MRPIVDRPCDQLEQASEIDLYSTTQRRDMLLQQKHVSSEKDLEIVAGNQTIIAIDNPKVAFEPLWRTVPPHEVAVASAIPGEPADRQWSSEVRKCCSVHGIDNPGRKIRRVSKEI